MLIVLSIIIVFSFVAYRAFMQKILNEKQQQHQRELAYQKEVSLQYTIVQENERKRIAETLHDEVGSKLNLLSLWINNDDTWNNERAKEIVVQQIPALINATRNASHALYPVNLESLGIILLLEQLIEHIDSSLLVQLNILHTYHKKPIAIELQLFRIIQEFLCNVIKHANATKMNIQIRDTKQSLSIVLSDNGIGFNRTIQSRGMGLKNIETRIESINALYKWKSKKNKGCTLILLLLKNE